MVLLLKKTTKQRKKPPNCELNGNRNMEKVLLFHLPCLCADFEGYPNTKLLGFISVSLHFKMLLLLLYFWIFLDTLWIFS